MLVISLVIARAILLLERRENAVEKMLAVIVHHFSDPACFDDIDPVTENGHGMKVRARRAADNWRAGLRTEVGVFDAFLPKR